MSSAVACPHCGTRLKLPGTFGGGNVRCPNCSTAFTPATHSPAPIAPSVLVQLSPCPYCGEAILVTAKKCKHCGEFLDPSLRAPAQVVMPIPMHQPQQSHSSHTSHTTVVVKTGGGFPHFLHAILTLFTCGLWFPVWLLAYIFRSR